MNGAFLAYMVGMYLCISVVGCRLNLHRYVAVKTMQQYRDMSLRDMSGLMIYHSRNTMEWPKGLVLTGVSGIFSIGSVSRILVCILVMKSLSHLSRPYWPIAHYQSYKTLVSRFMNKEFVFLLFLASIENT